jgi:hypothetical protein
MRIGQIGLLSFTILGAAMTLGWPAEPDLEAGAAANRLSNQAPTPPPTTIVVPAPKAPDVDDLTKYGGCSDCAPGRPQTPFEAGAAANRLSNQAPAPPPKTIVVPASKAPDVDDLTKYGGCSDCAPGRPQTPLEAGAANNRLSNQAPALPPTAIVVPARKALRAGGFKLSISRDSTLKTMPKVDRSVHVRAPTSRSPAIAKLPDAGRGAARTLVAHPAGLDTLHARSSPPKTAGGNFNAAAKSLQSNSMGGFNTSKPTQLSGGAGSFHAPKVSAMDALSNSNFGNKSSGGSADKLRRPK